MKKSLSSRFCRRLTQHARRLPAPTNYFNGLRIFTSAAPDNILMFYRDRLDGINRFDRVHHRFVLIINLQTPGRIVLDQRLVVLQEAEALLVFPHQFHHYIISPRVLSWLFITFEMPQADMLVPLRNNPVPIVAAAGQNLAQLVTCYLGHSKSPNGILRMACLLNLLMLDLLASAKSNAAGAGQAGLAGAFTSKVIEQVNTYIHSHIHQRLTIAELARHVGFSPSHLRLLFRQYARQSLGAYLKTIRIQQSLALLAQSGVRIKEIANTLGFSSSEAFIRMVHREFGQSPRQIRTSLLRHGSVGTAHGRVVERKHP